MNMMSFPQEMCVSLRRHWISVTPRTTRLWAWKRWSCIESWGTTQFIGISFGFLIFTTKFQDTGTVPLQKFWHSHHRNISWSFRCYRSFVTAMNNFIFTAQFYLVVSRGAYHLVIIWRNCSGWKVTICLDMFAQRAWVSVPFWTARHLAHIRLVNRMGTSVLKAITRVGIGLTTARDRTYIRPFTCNNSVHYMLVRINSDFW